MSRHYGASGGGGAASGLRHVPGEGAAEDEYYGGGGAAASGRRHVPAEDEYDDGGDDEGGGDDDEVPYEGYEDDEEDIAQREADEAAYRAEVARREREGAPRLYIAEYEDPEEVDRLLDEGIKPQTKFEPEYFEKWEKIPYSALRLDSIGKKKGIVSDPVMFEDEEISVALRNRNKIAIRFVPDKTEEVLRFARSHIHHDVDPFLNRPIEEVKRLNPGLAKAALTNAKEFKHGLTVVNGKLVYVYSRTKTKKIIDLRGVPNHLFDRGELSDWARQSSTILYECREASGVIPSSNVIREYPYIRLYPFQTVVRLDQMFRTLLDYRFNTFMIVTTDKVLKAVVSQNVADSQGSWVGGLHCQPGTEVKVAEILVYKDAKPKFWHEDDE